jgi:hypothetical protein
MEFEAPSVWRIASTLLDALMRRRELSLKRTYAACRRVLRHFVLVRWI